MQSSEPQVDPKTVQRLVLARLLVPSKQPPSRARTLKSVADAICPPLSRAAAAAAASGGLEACEAAGWIAAPRGHKTAVALTSRGRAVLPAQFGGPLPAVKSWLHAQQLVALSARGKLAAARKPLRADELAAVALAQRWDVPASIATLPAVVDYLAWRALGVETTARFEVEKVQRHLLQKLVPADVRVDRNVWRRMLAMRSIEAPGHDARALLQALLCGAPRRRPQPKAAAAPADRQPRGRPKLKAAAGPANRNAPRRTVQPSLGDFARAVQEAARLPTVARFHDDRAFIASIWDHLRGREPVGELSLPEFKQRLIAAHRDGLVRITRADLVGAMDPREVERSEARYQDATFHFVALEAGG